MNLLNGFVSEISSGLDSIAMQEKLLRDNGREGHGMSRSEMKQSIKELAEMLTRQRERLAAYENSSNGAKIEGLQSIITHLNNQLEEKQKLITKLYAEINNSKASIATLRSHISSLNENVAKLDRENKAQQEALVVQNEMINEGYLKIADKKTLKQLGIISGGGLLNKIKLNPSALTQSNFTRVNITKFTEVTIKSKKPRILTTMPSASYKIINNGDGTSILKITDPTSFWGASNYLVVCTD